MKHFSKRLRIAALLLVTLNQYPRALAQTNTATTRESSTTLASQTSVTTTIKEPQVSRETAPLNQLLQAKQGLRLQQNGKTLSILYQPSTAQKAYKIQYAIWSEEGGQDDLHWYMASDKQTDIALTNHKGYGRYQVHAYIFVGDTPRFLQATSFVLNKAQTTVTTAISQPGFLDIHVQNVPLHTESVRIPVWTVNKGQDDLRWYTATPNNRGDYSLRVPLKNHHFETGTYTVHLYLKEKQQVQTFVANTAVKVAPSNVPAQSAPTITITNLHATNGTYQVNIRETARTKIIKSVDVATWSMAKQENIVWRTAQVVSGGFLAKVDFQHHKEHTGHYQNHVYVTYADGSRIGYIAQTVDLTKARLPIQFSNQLAYVGNMSITIKNVYDNTPVNYAVWSDTNGQDDLKWYPATKSADKTFTGNIPLNNHTGSGLYHVHVYQGNTGLGAFTMQVNQAHRVTEVNTYPIGQCTWGVKELAPWVRNYWGNANQWGYSARAAGFKTGSTPRVGAVAVWTAGQYGHVAVVTEVSSPTRIRVKEANYAGKQYIGDFRGWFDPLADGVTEYIYPN